MFLPSQRLTFGRVVNGGRRLQISGETVAGMGPASAQNPNSCIGMWRAFSHAALKS